MIATLSGGEYGIGKTLARARAGEPSGLDVVRLVAWRKLVADGADAFAAFATVATHPDYGFRSWRGRASLPLAAAARKFRAFAARMALTEFETARAHAALVIAGALPATAERVVHLATADAIDDPRAAHVNLAAARIVLEAGGVIGSRRAGATVHVTATASAVAGESPQDLAARIAGNPEASRRWRELLAIVDPAGG